MKGEDYYPFAWEEATYKGKVYALPFNTDTRALWYNKDIMQQAGLPRETTDEPDELRKATKTLTQKNTEMVR